jgi:sensor domain CHASE-containing protein
MRAMQSGQVAISDPHEFRVGGLVIAARFAIYFDGKFWGLANLVVDLPSHLAAAGMADGKRLKLALRDSRQRVFFGDPAILADAPVIDRIPLPEGSWDLAAVPIQGWSAAIEENLRLFDAGALSAVILLSVVAYLIAFRDARLESAVGHARDRLGAERYRKELAGAQSGRARLQAPRSVIATSSTSALTRCW